MVEGHRGSLICARCLTVAYLEVVVNGGGSTPPPGTTCALCLEERKQRHWQTPARGEAWACERCIRQSGQMLEKDEEAGWKRPGR